MSFSIQSEPELLCQAHQCQHAFLHCKPAASWQVTVQNLSVVIYYRLSLGTCAEQSLAVVLETMDASQRACGLAVAQGAFKAGGGVNGGGGGGQRETGGGEKEGLWAGRLRIKSQHSEWDQTITRQCRHIIQQACYCVGSGIHTHTDSIAISISTHMHIIQGHAHTHTCIVHATVHVCAYSQTTLWVPLQRVGRHRGV